ncbi:TetR/AcrR family transcriptional regulator [Bacillus toyonensis]|uniref:TetR/AcrR family transcriptional regulator n=1 Tax=Bacillus toyonensis TaxID=155322 RepID=UPI002175B9B7|nr:TetR/AcrR family transcriptional regulator [Bacillus toyonensis]
MKNKSPETRNKILEATLALVAENGFHGTSVSQIAAKSKVNVGSMYYHFNNKDDILKALYIHCKKQITQYVFNKSSEDMPPDECLKRMMFQIVHYFMENEAEKSFMEQFENSPYYAEIASSTEYTEIMKPYMELYVDAGKEGLIKDLPLAVVQSLMYGAITSLTTYYLSNQEITSESVLSEAIDAIWDMLKK